MSAFFIFFIKSTLHLKKYYIKIRYKVKMFHVKQKNKMKIKKCFT